MSLDLFRANWFVFCDNVCAIAVTFTGRPHITDVPLLVDGGKGAVILDQLVHPVSQQVGNFLERQEVPARDIEN